MARRITGSSVSKGDLVRRKYTQLSLDLERRDMHAEKLDSGELGVVITTIPRWDRTYGQCDCQVFWSRSMTVVDERSIDLRILSVGS